MDQAKVEAGIIADTDSLIRLGLGARKMALDLSAGARSILAGAHLSRFRGRGMDFSESREYQPGDDVRHIDWRVTARTGEPHTKLYTEERERPVFLVLDFSSTMFFGTRGCFKSVTAARAAAYIAWSVVANGDRVGGLVATPRRIVDAKPTSGRRGVLRLLNAISDATDTSLHTQVDQHTLLDDTLRHAVRVVHPGSLVIIFSDFYRLDNNSRRYISRLARHNDLVACQALDPLEIAPPKPGHYLVSDGQVKTTLDASGANNRRRYQGLIESRDDSLKSLLSEFNIPLIQLINGEDVSTTLSNAFGNKQGGRRI